MVFLSILHLHELVRGAGAEEMTVWFSGMCIEISR